MADRIYTKKELKGLGTKAVDLVTEAIDADDKERAKKLSKYMHSTFFSMHDMYVDWVTALMSYIYRRYGDEVLHDAMDKTYGELLKPLIKKYVQEKDMQKKVQLLVGTLQGHMETMKITEDDEKFTFEVNPCGSGGRLFRRGGYEPPKNLAKLKKPQVLTYNTKDFPIYCCHCPVHEMLAMDETGRPWIISEPPKNWAKDPCRIYLYKNTAEVPEKWYTRVGKKKGQVKAGTRRPKRK